MKAFYQLSFEVAEDLLNSEFSSYQWFDEYVMFNMSVVNNTPYTLNKTLSQPYFKKKKHVHLTIYKQEILKEE